MNAFAKYLELSATSHTKMAERLDCARPHVTKMSKGWVNPSLRMAARIEIVTNGMVPVSSWAPPLIEEESKRFAA